MDADKKEQFKVVYQTLQPKWSTQLALMIISVLL